MGLIEVLDKKTIFFDTAPFIYVFENKLPYKRVDKYEYKLRDNPRP